MTYRAVLFDLFDTLVAFDRTRLPELTIKGKVVRSTAGQLYEAFHPFAPGIDLGEFVDGLMWSWQEAERLRNEDYREVAAPERLAMLVRRLGFDPAKLAADAMPTLLATHMRELSKAIVFPPHHGPLLRSLQPRYRLAVVSNFDYTPTAMGVLEREGIAGLFETIVVSDEVGWRKPKPLIFELASAGSGSTPPMRSSWVTASTSTWRVRRAWAWDRPGSTPSGRRCLLTSSRPTTRFATWPSSDPSSASHRASRASHK